LSVAALRREMGIELLVEIGSAKIVLGSFWRTVGEKRGIKDNEARMRGLLRAAIFGVHGCEDFEMIGVADLACGLRPLVLGRLVIENFRPRFIVHLGIVR